MGQALVTYCNDCGAKKQETNHWIQVVGTARAPRFQEFDPSESALQDLCGQRCATTVFQRWLDTGSVTKAEVPA